MQKRFEVRRSTQILTEVAAPSWDVPVALLARDLSPRGMYLQSERIPEIGEHLFCAFALARAPREHCFLSKVNRVNWHRRRTDQSRPGFGVEFLDVSPLNRLRIRSALRGLPPPLPSGNRGSLFESPRFEGLL